MVCTSVKKNAQKIDKSPLQLKGRGLYLFAVRSAVLAYDDLCGLGVGALDIDREFQNLIIVPHIQPSQGQGVQPQLQLRLPAAALPGTTASTSATTFTPGEEAERGGLIIGGTGGIQLFAGFGKGSGRLLAIRMGIQVQVAFQCGKGLPLDFPCQLAEVIFSHG